MTKKEAAAWEITGSILAIFSGVFSAVTAISFVINGVWASVPMGLTTLFVSGCSIYCIRKGILG